MRFLLGLWFFAGACHATSLPTQLSQADLSEVTRVVVAQSAVRVLRSAEGYASWPGVKFGLESTIAPISQLKDLGAANGSVEGINIVPRLYLAKGLFGGAEMIVVWFPDGVANTLGSLGGMLKVAVLNETFAPVSFAGYAGFTAVSAFEGTFSGRNIETGAILSKDFVRVKPFIGFGFNRSYGESSPLFMLGNTPNTITTLSTHLFAGMEFEFPMHITVQADLINVAPSVSVLISKRL